MKSLMIKDLEISKELTRDDLSAVRGGTTQTGTNSQTNIAAAFGGYGIGNPATAVVVGGPQLNTQVNSPVLTNLFGFAFQA